MAALGDAGRGGAETVRIPRVASAGALRRATDCPIHAGARPVRKDEVRDLLLRLHSSFWRETGLAREGSIKLLEPVLLAPGRLPLSSVLCTAILGEPIRDAALAAQLGTHAVNDSDRDQHSNWGWPLTDIERLEPFVPATGKQGFWDWRRG